MRVLVIDDSMPLPEGLQALLAGTTTTHQQARHCTPTAAQVTIAVVSEEDGQCACKPFNMGSQPEYAATILDAVGLALLNRGCLNEGGPLIKQARAIRYDYLGSDHPSSAQSQNSYARLRRERGEYKDAEAAARDALRINQLTFGAESLPAAVSLYHLAATQLDQGNFKAAEATASEGFDIMQAQGCAADDPNTTRLLEIRGRAELNLGKLNKSAATYLDLLERDLRELGTRDHIKYVTHAANFGTVKEAQGDLKEAEAAYRQAIDFFVKSIKRPCHPNLIDIYANLGSLLRKRGDCQANEEIGKVFHKALELDRQVRGDSHVLVANDHANLGRWQYDNKQTQGALASFTRALDILEQHVKEGELPPEHFFLAEARTWKGRTLVESNNRDTAAEAQALLELAVIHWPAQLGPGSRFEGTAKACLGRALYLQDKSRKKACDLLCQGYAIIKKTSPELAFVQRVEGWIEQQGCNCDECR